jgi:molybdopterin molybdotransferase
VLLSRGRAPGAGATQHAGDGSGREDGGADVIPVEEHLAGCLAAVEVLPAVRLAPLDAVDCVLAEGVVSEVDLPGFDNSSMDGYAVTMPDVATVAPDRPVTLPVIADVPAGGQEPRRITPGAAIRIMTGAPLPAGADAVVPVEWTDRGLTRVEISRAPHAGQYVRAAGDDVRAGQTVLRAGTRLGGPGCWSDPAPGSWSCPAARS